MHHINKLHANVCKLNLEKQLKMPLSYLYEIALQHI